MVNHPLFNQLSEKASILLPQLGFKVYKSDRGMISFISNDSLVVTIQHCGYDMPQIYFGNKQTNDLLGFLNYFEKYLNTETLIAKKHHEFKSFYDFEYEYEIIKTYHFEIVSTINNPKSYLKWKNQIHDVK